jgi:iron(III) transport system ATP-binding protein
MNRSPLSTRRPARGFQEFADLLLESRQATLLVTHDIDEAAALCESCIIIDRGRVLQYDKMDAVLQRPVSRRVAEIIDVPNVMQGTVVGSTPHATSLSWNGHGILAEGGQTASGKLVDFIIRPELIGLHKVPGDQMNTVPGKVARIRRRGRIEIFSIRVGELDLLQVLAVQATISGRVTPSW